MTEGRLITIGDVHGCATQLAQLLAWLSPNDNDRIIFVGDLVCKGPDSGSVLDIVLALGAECVQGNHERRLFRYRATGSASVLKPYDGETLRQLRPAHWEYLSRLPLTIEVPEYQSLIVHGGFLPKVPWREQGPEIVTRIQVIDPEGNAAKRGDFPRCHAWANEWPGPEFVIYGHTPRRAPLVKPLSIGIDTGAVYGGRLTAFVWPEGAVYQVKGNRRFHHQYYPLHPAECPTPHLEVIGADIQPPRLS